MLETGEPIEVSGRLGRYWENSSLLTGGIKSAPNGESSSVDCAKMAVKSPLS